MTTPTGIRPPPRVGPTVEQLAQAIQQLIQKNYELEQRVKVLENAG